MYMNEPIVVGANIVARFVVCANVDGKLNDFGGNPDRINWDTRQRSVATFSKNHGRFLAGVLCSLSDAVGHEEGSVSCGKSGKAYWRRRACERDIRKASGRRCHCAVTLALFGLHLHGIPRTGIHFGGGHEKVLGGGMEIVQVRRSFANDGEFLSRKLSELFLCSIQVLHLLRHSHFSQDLPVGGYYLQEVTPSLLQFGLGVLGDRLCRLWLRSSRQR